MSENSSGYGPAPTWDSHVHLLPERRSRSLVRWIKRAFPEHPSREGITHEQIIADLRGCGVEVAFNLVFPLREDETDDLNDFSAELGRRFDFIIPFGSLHAQTPRKDEVAERCLVEKGLAGMKLHPYAQGFEAFSREFEPLFGKLNELGRPFIVHTGFDVFYGRTQDLDYLRGMLERYPEMPVVLVHSLFPRFRLAHELMGEHPKLYVDMTNVVSAIKWYLDAPPATWTEMAADRELFDSNLDYFQQILEDFSDRAMFGTDHPVGMGSPEQIYADFESFGFAPEVRRDLLGATARRFLEKCCGLPVTKCG